MKRPEPPLEILEAWGQRGVPVDAPEDAEGRRQAVVGSMGRLIREEKQRHARRKRWLWSIGAAAAVALAGAVYLVRPAAPSEEAPVAAVGPAGASLQVTSGVVVTLRGEAAIRVGPGPAQALALNDELRLGQGVRGTALLPRGVRVDLAEDTRATLVSSGEAEQRFRLAQGTLTVSVPKPGGPHTFAINTPDAEVVVHGTQFSTRVERTDGLVRTFVQVTRGAVLVVRGDSQSLVRAGQSWASPEPAADQRVQASPSAVSAGTRPSSAIAATEPGIVHGRKGEKTQAHAATAGARAATDALAEQNRLFQAALDARAAGDDAAVVRHLDRLLVRFPKTELAREARLARFRALKRLGREGEAAREAGRYLLDHPDGPSRGEARDLSSR